jgi:hypothetical protein
MASPLLSPSTSPSPRILFCARSLGHAITITTLASACRALDPNLELHFFTTTDDRPALQSAIDQIIADTPHRVYAYDHADLAGVRSLLLDLTVDVVVADCVALAMLVGWSLPTNHRPILIFASALAQWKALNNLSAVVPAFLESMQSTMMSLIELYAGANCADAFLGPCPFPTLIDDRRDMWRRSKCMITDAWIRPALKQERWRGDIDLGDVVLYISGIQSEERTSAYERSFCQWAQRWKPHSRRVRIFGRSSRAENPASFGDALCTCSLLITTAGMGVLTEVAYLGVPTVLVPVQSLFVGSEQLLNAVVADAVIPWVLHVPSELACAPSSPVVFQMLEAFVMQPSRASISAYDDAIVACGERAVAWRDADPYVRWVGDGTLEAAEFVLRSGHR